MTSEEEVLERFEPKALLEGEVSEILGLFQ